LKVGDLFRFGFVNGRVSGELGHRRTGVYLGRAFIHRDDGVTVENHIVILSGDKHVTTIDKGLLRHMRVINESR